MLLAPVALFTYNRPEHTLKTLEALSKNPLAENTDLYVFIDGAKKPEDQKNINEVEQIIKSKKWCGRVIIKKSEKNLGLFNSVTKGINSVLENHDKIIVLEDDLITAQGFLTYMNKALDKYASTKKVMHISGYQYPVKFEGKESLFHRRTTSWGWATWKDRWAKFEMDADKLKEEVIKKSIKQFNIDGTTNRFGMLEKEQNHIMKSWAIRWAATVFINNGLVLWPYKSLIQNIGHDGSGVNCDPTEWYTVNFDPELFINDFPEQIKEDEAYLKVIKSYYNKMNKSERESFRKLKYYIKRLMDFAFESA